MTEALKVPDEAIESAARAIGDIYGHEPDDYRSDARAALEAAFPHIACTCPHISEVDDWCPQHGRDS